MYTTADVFTTCAAYCCSMMRQWRRGLTHLLHEGLLLLQHDGTQCKERGLTQLMPHGGRAAASWSNWRSSWSDRSIRVTAVFYCMACLLA
jgi:hypothetical protein